METEYKITNPQFVIEENVSDEFPNVLDFTPLGCESKKDAMRFIGRNLTVTFPENEYATRKMDDNEKCELRGRYCSLVENILPDRKRQLEEALEEAKRLKKEAEELYSSTLQEINMMAAEVKLGTVEERLKGSDTFCMALAGYYLTYTWNEDRHAFVLAKAVEIPDTTEIFANDENNRQQMLELFGCEFPYSDEEKDDVDAF
ncbi:MAG: hypothetical protein ACI3YI_05150 [Bacteroidaceae bacterium]